MSEYIGEPNRDHEKARLAWLLQEVNAAVGDDEKLLFDDQLNRAYQALLVEINKLRESMHLSESYVPSELAMEDIQKRTQAVLALIHNKKQQLAYEQPEDDSPPAESKTTYPN